MKTLHLSIRIDRTDEYYYPPRDGITVILRVILEKLQYNIVKLIMAEEVARKTKKVHCHVHAQINIPQDSKTYKSLAQKIIREINKQDKSYLHEPLVLPPRQFSISEKQVKDILRFMRYPLKDQEDLSGVYSIGYDDDPYELEIQRRLAFEERIKAIAEWEKSQKKKDTENNTFQELVDYLRYHAPIETSLPDYEFSRTSLERIGTKIVTFYRIYKKGKLPFNIDKILFRYLLHQQIASDREIFQMMSRT